METKDLVLRNWGNYPSTASRMYLPEDRGQLIQVVKESETVLARGNGKCYGDAALGPHVVSTLNLKAVLEFDSINGIIHAESGVLLSDLLPTIVSSGWFFHVTPGIKAITLGGAVASDVHGKNHPAKGCFSNWVEGIELLLSDGEVVWCTKEEHADLFWQTFGGMGWTGVVLSVKFRLMRIQTTQMLQKSVQAAKLDELFDAFEENQDYPYAAAWMDCLKKGSQAGRGVLYLARHKEEKSDTALGYPETRTRNIPFFAPPWMLNRISISAHNRMLFNRSSSEESVVDMDHYFYPLDRIRNWNRLYGRRGFIQYQFCIPEQVARQGIGELLDLLHSNPNLPFLSVLKRHGARPSEAIHSFPEKGYSLALDFPRKRSIFDLVKQMDDLVWSHGGKVYLTKDACSHPRMGRVDPSGFGNGKFYSLLKARIQQ